MRKVRLPKLLLSNFLSNLSALFFAKPDYPLEPPSPSESVQPYPAERSPPDPRHSQLLQRLRQAIDQPTAIFQAGQFEAIVVLLDQQRLLVVQRTGWGKSMVYFLATRWLRDRGFGPTLLVSPLLSLMRNQLAAARRIGLQAETVNSTNQHEWQAIEARLRSDTVDLLLIAPERLANERFINQSLQSLAGRIGLLVVDEAHCISTWGHDFRPDYRRIARILNYLPPNIAVLATTATANQPVVNDIRAQLGGGLTLQRGPLLRQSLRLQNIRLPDRADRMAWLAGTLPHLPGSGIVYTLTIRDAEQLALWLRKQGMMAAAYHAKLDNAVRIEREKALLSNQLKVLVATTALGMGFDKPDLGFVIHFQAPASVIHYYQQVGRAGRALPNAYGILLGGAEDEEINRYLIDLAFPADEHIQAIMTALTQADYGLTVPQLEKAVNLRRSQIEQVLRILAVQDQAPIARQGRRWLRTLHPLRIERDQIEHLHRQRYGEWRQMQQYLDSRTCLMRFLAEALDDPYPQACGKCAACIGRSLLPVVPASALARQAVAFLEHSETLLEPRQYWSEDAFPQYGWHGEITPVQRNQVGRILCHWGDPGWGRLVRQGKLDGRFPDPLVRAVVELVTRRWPEARPEWITGVPSHRHPRLVYDFARRLATALAVPFRACIVKGNEIPPQKMMENGFHQAHNLDGAFIVEATAVLPGAVLLVDDMVDSGWTLTVIGALLRQAGSGPVFPLALAATTAY